MKKIKAQRSILSPPQKRIASLNRCACFFKPNKSEDIARNVSLAETKRNLMGTILLIILILLLVGALPAWPYSRGWGYYPSGGLGLVLVIVIILVLMRAV
jgi:hypothetical protein